MIVLKINHETKTICNNILKKINLGTRGNRTDGTPDQQLTGLIGEIGLLQFIGRNVPSYTKGIKGHDLVINDSKLDVKTMTRTVTMQPHYVHNLIGLQKNNITDGYIFCSYNMKQSELEICGYTSKKDFFDNALFYMEGDVRERDNGTKFKTFTDLYEIGNEKLTEINSKDDILSIKLPT